jgi:hypothetical protein
VGKITLLLEGESLNAVVLDQDEEGARDLLRGELRELNYQLEGQGTSLKKILTHFLHRIWKQILEHAVTEKGICIGSERDREIQRRRCRNGWS